MKLPAGVTFHYQTRIYREGDEVPPELEARLPEEVRLRAAGKSGKPAAEETPSGPAQADHRSRPR